MLRSATVAVLIGTCLTACAATPDIAPTARPSTGADAFAAAEATYRAYVDALNQVDLSDPATFEAVYAWTTGESNANERRALTKMHAESLRLVGTTVIEAFIATERHAQGSVSAVVCTNVSAIDLLDPSGPSSVAPDRPDRYELEIEFVPDEQSDHGFLILSSNAVQNEHCKS